MKHSWRKCFVTAADQGNSRNNNKREKLKTASIERSMKISNSHVSTSSAKKVKRFRSAFTTEQVTYLEREFRKYPYIGNSRRKDVASVLDIPERAVKIWFQNRRMKEKKESPTKESEGESKRNVEVEEKSHLYLRKKDQVISLPQLTSPQILVTESFMNNVNQSGVNVESPKYLIQENTVDSGIFYQSTSLLKSNSASALPQSDNLSQDREENLKTENVANTYTSKVHDQGSTMKGHQTSIRKVSDRKLSGSPYSFTILPQDLSSRQRADWSHDQKIFKDSTKTLGQSPLDLTSRANSAAVGSPVYVEGYYPQPYMPPGNMIWRPVNMTPIMSTGLPTGGANVSLQFGPQQPLPKTSCTCDCHTKYTPVQYQPNGHNLLQYFITAVPISGQPSA